MEELLKNKELIKKIYDFCNYDWNKKEELDNMIKNDYKYGYLTINKGYDNQDYVWYLDNQFEAIVNIATGELITDGQKIYEILGDEV